MIGEASAVLKMDYVSQWHEEGVDASLHNSSAFTLAARLDADSLELFVDHLRGDKADLDELIIGGMSREGTTMPRSALHSAAYNQTQDTLR